MADYIVTDGRRRTGEAVDVEIRDGTVDRLAPAGEGDTGGFPADRRDGDRRLPPVGVCRDRHRTAGARTPTLRLTRTDRCTSLLGRTHTTACGRSGNDSQSVSVQQRVVALNHVEGAGGDVDRVVADPLEVPDRQE